MSNFMGEILISEEELQARINELGEQISKDFEGEEVVLICVLKGACMFLSDLMKRISTIVTIDFMAVSSYGNALESSGVVKISKDLDSSIEGKNVIIVEDILDTGLTLKYLYENLLTRNPKTLKIATLLEKPARKIADIEADYTGFEVEDRFIIGYGLDYEQKFRNLPYITCLD